MIALLDNHKDRFIRLAALLFLCLLWGGVSLRAQTTQSPIPQPNPPAPVVDTADVIDAATEQRLNNILKNLSENSTANAEFGVVTVRTTGGRDIFEYSLAIMRGWGIGSTDKGGLLLVVAVEDRKYFTQVSRHLEGDLPDGLVGQIQRERLVPLFKQGNYNQGISDTVEAYVATLAAKRGFSVEGIDQRRAYRGGVEDAPSGATSSRSSRGLSRNMIVIIIIIVVFLLLSSRGGGSRGGCGGGGCLNMLLLNSLFNSGRGGWGSSGWGGGGFGGGSGWGGGGGGGGGDWGGFSGGGGDAGGGGAGGGW